VLRSYIAIALRQLLAQKLYTAINVAGLALGLACTLLIALFVRHELSYDRQYAASERIVRISEYLKGVGAGPVAAGAPLEFAGSAPAIAPLLKDSFPQVEKSARLLACFDVGGGTRVKVDGRTFVEPRLFAADNELFEIFDFEWRAGDPRTALTTPNAVVLTASTARRYLGDAAALGRTLTVFEGLDVPLVVTGVIADLPDNTHLELDLLMSLSYLPAEALASWGGNCYHTYALLEDGADAGAVTSGSDAFYEKRFGNNIVRAFAAVPIRDIHLRSRREGELRTPGDLTNVYALAAIAVFVLLIACINFVNLATARATKRAKEVGMRKVLGGTRRQLIAQFLGESFILTVTAVALALAIVVAMLEPFAAFVERDIAWRDLTSPTLLATIAAVTALVAFGSGSYPALLLSRFNPVRVLRSEIVRGAPAAAFRKSLVMLQFSISIALVIATLVVFDQERFARSYDLGYDKDQIVVVTGSQGQGLGPQWESMKGQWRNLPGVQAVTASSFTPGTRIRLRSQMKIGGEEGLGFLAQMLLVDAEFFETYKIHILAGRTFAADGSDREVREQPGQPPPPTPWVLSALSAERYGWTPEEALGRTIEVGGRGGGVVIGVVADIHFESVRDPVTPLVYLMPSGQPREASIRVTGADLETTLAGIDAVWRELGPDVPILRRFLDDDLDALYRGEQKQAQLLTLFSALAILIACLGLFGLASAATLRRTKEIGIRKALGASVADIVRLLTTEFGALVLMANVVAWPVAYFAMQRWLSGFAYRIELGPVVFVASAALALVVAVLTVAAVATRAARAKPVATLRYE
jgi:putative ABC transport system permease protein